MESNVSVRQCKEGLSHSCHPGRGLQLIPHAGLTKSGVKPGGDESPPSGIGPWLGARVAPQHCPILRPGQDHGKQNGSSLQLQPNVGFQKEDISNELRMRTFLTSCDIAQQKQQNDQLNQAINRERAERGELQQEVARLREQQAPPPTFALGFGEIERSKGGPPQAMKLTVPHGAEVIKLRLDLLKDQYENYLVVVENAQQHDIWRGLLQATKAERGKAVVVRLPSRLFVTGEYKLTLSGTNDKREYEVISDFNLDVTRK